MSPIGRASVFQKDKYFQFFLIKERLNFTHSDVLFSRTRLTSAKTGFMEDSIFRWKSLFKRVTGPSCNGCPCKVELAFLLLLCVFVHK